MKVIEIWINCPSKDVATEIAEILIKHRLIASSNIYQNIASSYHWKGRIEKSNEVPLLVKTRSELFEHVVKCVNKIHPYETPSVMGIEIDLVNDEYRDWVFSETAKAEFA